MKTTDIYFAAALLSLGADLKNVDKTDPRHMEFEFNPQKFESPILSDAVTHGSISILPLTQYETQWANGTLVGNFSKYAESIKRLKSVVHSK